MLDRVVATNEATALVERLRGKYGLLIFHQSGGCCEGTAPMCFKRSDFRVGPNDLFLGYIAGQPFYIGRSQSAYCADSQLIIDVTKGGGDSFSIEAADGVRFITRSRLLSEDEKRDLAAEASRSRS